MCFPLIFQIERDYGVCDSKLVGSAGDGFGFFASQGNNKLPFEALPVLTQDIDLNIFLNSVQLNQEHLHAIPGSEGFTKIKLQV